MRLDDKAFFAVAIVAALIGYYHGTKHPKYVYFDRSSYVLRHEQGSAEMCGIVQNQVVGEMLVASGISLCEAEGISRLFK